MRAEGILQIIPTPRERLHEPSPHLAIPRNRDVCLTPKPRGEPDFDPSVVVLDPISDLVSVGSDRGRSATAMLTREVDFLKGRGVTALFTTLASDSQAEPGNQLVASLIDTVLLVRTLEGNGEHNRVLSALKSRGMAHSNQVREFLLTDRGIELADVYVGPQGVLTGSARSAQEAKEQSDASGRQKDLQQRRDNLERERLSVEARVADLWREFSDEADAVDQLLNRGATGREEGAEQRLEQGRLRSSGLPSPEERTGQTAGLRRGR